MGKVYLGDKELTLYKIKEVAKPDERFGITLDTLFGPLSEGGQLKRPEGSVHLNLKGVKTLGDYALANVFYGWPLALGDSYATLDAPDLVEIVSSGAEGVFKGGYRVSNISMPNLTTVGSRGLYYAFAAENNNNTTSMTVDISNIESVADNGMYFAFQYRKGLTQEINLFKLTSVKSYSFAYCFFGAGITAFRAPNLETAASHAFWNICQNCTALQEVDLSGLSGVLQTYGLTAAFYACTSLKALSLPKITSLESYAMNNMCQNCTALTTVDLSGLTTLYNGVCLERAFYGCSALTTVKFNSLATVPNSSMNYCFQNCTALEKIDFPMLFEIGLTGFGSSSSSYAFTGCTNLKEIHFRQDAQAVVEKTTGYADKWGAPNATIYFDL